MRLDAALRRRVRRFGFGYATAMQLSIGDPFRLVYTSGNEHNPGDPVGSVALTIDGDGTVSVVNRSRGVERQWSGTTERSVIERILGHLQEAGFPAVPPHRIPPGSSLRRISIESAGATSSNFPTEWNAGATMAGYREAYQLLDSIVTEVTERQLKILGQPITGLVRPSAG